MRTLITGGLVITASDELAVDVLIEDEKVVALRHRPGLDGRHGRSTRPASTSSPAASTATPTWRCPSAARSRPTRSRPAPGPRRGAAPRRSSTSPSSRWARTLREGLDAWHAKAEGNCAIDYGFHMIMADVNEGSLKEMEGLVGEGVTSFKLFMAYPGVLYSDDGQVLRALQKGAETGGLILMHAENGIAIDVLIEQALARGQTDPRYHGVVRHELLEAEATHRAIKLAQVANAPVYIVHLSAEQALAEVAKARDEGYNAFAETCPQYLFLSTDDLARPGLRGRQVRLLDAAAPQGAPGRAVAGAAHRRPLGGVHRPLPVLLQGPEGAGPRRLLQDPQRAAGRRAPDGPAAHRRAWTGHISRRRWIEIACATPARMFGLYPRKGTIAPGSDADVVIYDPNAKQVFSAATHHMAVDYSCYEGKEITGKVETVLSRGRVWSSTATPTPARRATGSSCAATRAGTCASRKEPTWTSGWSCRPIPPAQAVVDLMVRAEGLGFSHGWTFDSHVLWQEPYVIYPRILERTSRMVVGPMVTNPGTRDWTVIASLHATLDEQFGHRTICGIGRGDSAVRVQGRPPTTLARLGGGDRRDPRAGRRAVRRPGRHAGADPVGRARGAGAAGVDGRVRAEGAGPGRPLRRRVHPAARRPLPRRVDGEDRARRRPRRRAATRRRSRSAWPRPRTSATTWRTPATSAAGSAGWSATTSPTSSPATARSRRRCPRSSPGTSRAARATTTATTAGRATRPPTSCPTRSSTGSACSGPPSAQLDRLAGLRALGVDQFAIYAMHDAREATIEAYGKSVIPHLPA